MKRVIILGFDGLDPKLICAWRHRLTNFDRLLSESSWGPLRSTIHPLTPQAWTSLVTGTNPGKHGINDFGRRAKNSYRIELVNSTHRRVWSIWELCSFLNVKVGIFNVPLTWPPDKVNGFLVGGMHSPNLNSIAYPIELGDFIKKNFPNYQIDTMIHWYQDESEFLNNCMEMMDVHWKVADWLWNNFSPEFFMPAFVAADRIMHGLWHTLSANVADTPDSNPIFAIHKKLDEVLGWAFDLCSPEDILIVCSDHGFGTLKKDVYLNRFLADAGYLRFDPKKVKKFKRHIQPESLKNPLCSWHFKKYGKPAPLPEDEELIIKGMIDPWYLDFETIDWQSTRAYSFGMMGNIFINLEGREPEGAVRWGKEYEELRDHIIRELNELCDPDDNKPICSAIYRKEELYWGPQFWEAPDIIVVLRDYEYTTRGATEFWGTHLTSEPVVNHTGNHRLNGFFAAWGDGIARRQVEGLDITDIAPLAMVHLGMPLPQYLDGKLPISMYNILSELKIVWEERNMERNNGKGYCESEEQVIRKRLKELGYLG